MPNAPDDPTTPDVEPAADARLDLHDRLRASGVPTLSVLVGPTGLAEAMARGHARRRGRPVVAIDRPDRGAMASAWIAGVEQGRDLVRDLADRLAGRLGRPSAGLADRLRGMTRFERETFLDGLPPAEGPDDPIPAARILLGDRAWAARDDPDAAVRAASALLRVVPEAGRPVLLAVSGGLDGEGLAAMAREWAALVGAEPGLSACWAISPDGFEALLRSLPEGRVRDLARAGQIPIAALTGSEIGRRLEQGSPGASSRLAGPIRRLASDGATPRLVDLFLDAAPGPDPSAPAAARRDASRSAAERFLLERLESLPETAGLFLPNARLPVPWGTRPDMEVDLSAPGLGIAVEIDGYFHFNDPESYRRDRRKDVALQAHGFLVLRVLADDVVPRLEATLDTILAAVAHRRATTTGSEGRTP